MKLNGSQILLECMKEQGVDTIFGYPGGAILNVYDELYKYSDQIRHVLTSHEQGAAHAADGYARATGKVGVCFATSGPGATNLVTGIATAYMDSIPIVAVTANVTVPLLGKDSFQEIDIAGVTMPITKHNYIVKDVAKLAETVRSAFRIAKEGRPGPVLIDIPKDVTAAICEYEPEVPEPIERLTDYVRTSDLNKAAEMINESQKPFVLVGGGMIISDADAELKTFVDKIQAPVCDTLMGKGAYDGRSENYTGMVGMHGTKASNLGLTKCDLLIVMGARFSDRVIGDPSKFATQAKILHIDIDAAEINKNITVDCSIQGDAREVLRKLIPMIEEKDRSSWLKEVEELMARFPLKFNHDTLTGPAVIEALYEATNGDAVIVTDVGQHQMWAAQYYKYKEPHTFLSSGGLGTMGYGLGAAIGAQVGRPEKKVINIAGDGCFRMNMNELATAGRYNIPVIEVVLNNHVLGMVRQWQTLFYGQRYSATTLNDNVDFVKVAEALGATGIRVTTLEELRPAIEKALAANGPVLLDCQIDSDDKVFPMIPAGKPLSAVFDQDDLKE